MEHLKDILIKTANGDISPEDAHANLLKNSYTDLGFANVDWGRSMRCGGPEIIYCKGKRAKDIIDIARLLANDATAIATKVTGEIAVELLKIFPSGTYNEKGNVFTSKVVPVDTSLGSVSVVTAGTSDIPVAEEAISTLTAFGVASSCFFDIGVAGIHRMLAKIDGINEQDIIIAVAGMDGVLPSVISGLVSKPVIAVPTSIGYGASFDGLSALLTMLNACSPGVAVMNIDNGFGAGYFAASILKNFRGGKL